MEETRLGYIRLYPFWLHLLQFLAFRYVLSVVEDYLDLRPLSSV